MPTPHTLKCLLAWPRYVGVLALMMTLGAGCILGPDVGHPEIGTWPIPEGAPQGTELCDELDNNGNGAIDEGCPCPPRAIRGCFGVAAEGCGPGLQYCGTAGRWTECLEVEALWERQEASLGEPQLVAPGETLIQTEVFVVEVPVQAPCAGVPAGPVDTVIQVENPAMRVRGQAHDDGHGHDREARDGIHTAAFPNPFGPGVGEQPLTVTTSLGIDGARLEEQNRVEW